MTTTIKITGMTCGHCEQAVSKALSEVPGVTRVVEVSRERQRAVVEGDADPRLLLSVVEEEGYRAEVAA